jgi:hypothetical protein
LNEVNEKILNIRRRFKTPTFTVSAFTIGKLSGFFMEPPPDRKEGWKVLLAPGFYRLTWSHFLSPKYTFNFKEQVPILFNNAVPITDNCFIGHGNRSIDTLDNSMLAGIWLQGGRMVGSVKTLKKLTEHLHEIGIQNVTVIIT